MLARTYRNRTGETTLCEVVEDDSGVTPGIVGSGDGSVVTEPAVDLVKRLMALPSSPLPEGEKRVVAEGWTLRIGLACRQTSDGMAVAYYPAELGGVGLLEPVDLTATSEFDELEDIIE